MFDIRRALKNDDVAVSAVIGTILMIAATVILGGVIYAAVNGFGQKDTGPKTEAVFKATSIDTDTPDDTTTTPTTVHTGPNQKTDAIKITYLTGPKTVDPSDISISLKRAADGAIVSVPALVDSSGNAKAWTPGDFVIVKPTNAQGTDYVLSISIIGNTVLDTVIHLDETANP